MSKKPGTKAPKAKASARRTVSKSITAAKVKKASAKAKAVAVAKPKLAKAAGKIAAAKPVKEKAPVGKPVTKAGAKASPVRTIATAKAAAPKKTEGPSKKMPARVKIADIVLPPDYKPSEDEPFMNDMHRAYFRKRLLDWKDEILRQTRETLAILHEDSTQHADLADRATSETDRATELRTRDRQRKLVSKIDAALSRIEDGTYGYCEDTGEPIGLKRLDARPIATLSVEAQERHERREKVYREE
jgi:DnaK suppressor protein